MLKHSSGILNSIVTEILWRWKDFFLLISRNWLSNGTEIPGWEFLTELTCSGILGFNLIAPELLLHTKTFIACAILDNLCNRNGFIFWGVSQWLQESRWHREILRVSQVKGNQWKLQADATEYHCVLWNKGLTSFTATSQYTTQPFLFVSLTLPWLWLGHFS